MHDRVCPLVINVIFTFVNLLKRTLMMYDHIIQPDRVCNLTVLQVNKAHEVQFT